MNTYRGITLTVLAGAAGLALAACAGGISTVSPAASPSSASTPATASSSASAPATASSSASPAATLRGTGTSRTVSVGGGVGSFPIPPGAGVLDYSSASGGYDLVLDGATAAATFSFYTTALPKAGYTITQEGSAAGAAGIQFTGRGYRGSIGAVSGGTFAGISVAGNSGSVIGIKFTRQ
jgi:hypothetical protein